MGRNYKKSIFTMKHFFLLTISPFLMTSCHTEGLKTIIPVQANNFVNVYRPQGDFFFGPSTKYLTQDKWYNEWIPNDHTFIQSKDGLWHIFGITHPEVISKPLNDGIHDGEYASFHCVSQVSSFVSSLSENHYIDQPKILTPSERPKEIPANHAPYIIEKNNEYWMIYGPSPIRLAISKDLYNWETQGALFEDPDGARDPNILKENGFYHITYCSKQSIRMVKTTDFNTFSSPKTILETKEFDPESPSLLNYNDTYYLFVCGWDGTWDQKYIQGAYQHVTHVYRSDDLHDFGIGSEKEITKLNAHAPEIFKDEQGHWYISSVEWPNRGVNVDRLEWN